MSSIVLDGIPYDVISTLEDDLETVLMNHPGTTLADGLLDEYRKLTIQEQFMAERLYILATQRGLRNMGPVSNAELAIKLVVFLINYPKGVNSDGTIK